MSKLIRAHVARLVHHPCYAHALILRQQFTRARTRQRALPQLARHLTRQVRSGSDSLPHLIITISRQLVHHVSGHIRQPSGDSPHARPRVTSQTSSNRHIHGAAPSDTARPIRVHPLTHHSQHAGRHIGARQNRRHVTVTTQLTLRLHGLVTKASSKPHSAFLRPLGSRFTGVSVNQRYVGTSYVPSTRI